MLPRSWTAFQTTLVGTVAALAITTGVTSTAEARAAAREGTTVCMGLIEHSEYANEGWYEVSGSNDACSFDGRTAEGKKILSVCPEGSRCKIDAYGKWAVDFYIKKVRSVRLQEKVSVDRAFSFPISRGEVSLVGVSGNTILDRCSKQSDQDYCLAWLQLAADNGRAIKAFYPGLRTCIPQEVDATQLRDVAIEHLRRHAKDRHMAANTLVAEAFYRAWPCQTDK